ncbi:MAG: hypothetical protein HY560_05200 [Gemmatimonadetes bacterium]|nr:hypothetical protein [Gemmatimonadota bacterium]
MVRKLSLAFATALLVVGCQPSTAPEYLDLNFDGEAEELEDRNQADGTGASGSEEGTAF